MIGLRQNRQQQKIKFAHAACSFFIQAERPF
jgi:hypothetical protein